jgi:hypothetical protein
MQVGQVLHGFCGGYLGKHDRHGCLRVEAVGFDWVVARDMERPGTPYFAEGIGIHLQLEEYTKPEPDCGCT